MIERAPPPADLADLVEEFSARSAVGRRAAIPVFASARTELLFHFADPFLIAGAQAVSLRPLAAAAVLGPRDRSYWQAAGPRVDWFIVQLTPLGCRRLLGCRFADLWHRDVPLVDFWGTSAADLHERLAGAATFRERVIAACAALRMQLSHETGDGEMSRLTMLARCGRLRDTAALGFSSDLGPRRLRQRFSCEIGIGPKHFLSIMRFGRLLTSLHPRPWIGGGEHDEPEYADDSHATRAFRRFAGTTPAAYRAAKSQGDELVFTGPAVPLA